MDVADEKRWWLLSTKTRKEAYAQQQLANQGYETYLPLAKRLRKKKNGQMVVKHESLFPSYLFISLDTVNDNWGPIRSTLGVRNFVRFGENPAQVPTEIITELQDNEDQLADRAIDLDRFKPGQAVLVNDGAFKDLQGIFQSYDGEQRAIILVSILQTTSKLVTSPVNVEAVD